MVFLRSMIQDIDLIVDGAGRLALVVPGLEAAGPLVLTLHPGRVTLEAEGGAELLADVGAVDASVLVALAAQGAVDLIALTDPDAPPMDPTHRARIQDCRTPQGASGCSLSNERTSHV